MQRVQPGHEVLSLWGLTPKAQALSANPAARSIAASLTKALFIVLSAAVILGTIARFGPTVAAPVATEVVIGQSLGNEPAAFQPGQFVSESIRQGYLQ